MSPEQLHLLVQAIAEPSWWVKINVIGFLVTIVLLAVYTIETARLRRYALLQLQRSEAPLVVIDRLISDTREMILTNVGTGAALNVRLRADHIAGEPVGKSVGLEHLTELRVCDLLPPGKSIHISTCCYDIVRTDGGFTFSAFAEGHIREVVEQNRFECDRTGLTLLCDGLRGGEVEIQAEITEGRVHQSLRGDFAYTWFGLAKVRSPLAVLRLIYDEEVQRRIHILNTGVANLLLSWYEGHLRRRGKTVHRYRILTLSPEDIPHPVGENPSVSADGDSESSNKL